MEDLNFYVLFIAALVPNILGMIWYNPKVFGNAWMKSLNTTHEDLQKGFVMWKAVLLTYFVGLFISFFLMPVVIHQMGVFSTLVDEPGFNESGSAMFNYFSDFMSQYGHNFRTFKHGALHGTMSGLFFALPIVALNAYYERKGIKYIAINAGFFTVCTAIMGGIICQFA